MIDKIKEKNWLHALYLWLESPFKVNNIDCSNNQFIEDMKNLQLYELTKKCISCRNTEESIGNEFNFKVIDDSCLLEDHYQTDKKW